MKICKAPGADAISAEVLKAGGDKMTKFYSCYLIKSGEKKTHHWNGQK